MSIHKWTDEQIRWLMKTYKEIKEDRRNYLADLTEEFNKTFGLNLGARKIKSAVERYVDYNLIQDEQITTFKKLRTAQVSRARVAKENRTILDQQTEVDTFLKEFKDIILKNPINLHKKYNKKPSKNTVKRILVGHISDTHIGANIDPEELGSINNYGPIQESRRHAFFFQQLVKYKPQHRKETELLLVLNGDLMQGIIHNHEDAEVMTTQFARALSVYVQGISYAAQHFAKVRVICTTGNHGRFMHKSSKQRATSKKWDGFHTILHVGLQTALCNYKNIEFEIPVTPYAYINVLNHKFFIAHGDTVINVGNVSKNINMGSIAAQTNEISTALGKFNVLLVGHVHKATYQILDNGIAVLINGCLSGTDPFAQSIGVLHNNPVQQLFEVTKDHCVGDVRLVRLKEADNIKELDKIIKPFTRKF